MAAIDARFRRAISIFLLTCRVFCEYHDLSALVFGPVAHTLQGGLTTT